MNLLRVNHLISLSLNVAVVTVVAVLVYKSRPRSVLHRAFAANQLAVSWWSFFTLFMITASTKTWGIFWDRLCFSGVVFIPATLFHYITAFTNDDQRLRKFTYLNYVLAILFLALLWSTRLLVYDVTPKFGMNYFTVPGPVYASFIAVFIVDVVAGLILIWRYAQRVQNMHMQRQVNLLFWFSIVGYGGGMCNYLLVYDIRSPGVAEFSNYGVLLLSLSLAYIIFKYRFLDIEVIVKRTLVFAGLSFTLFALFVALTFLVTTFLPTGLTGSARLLLFAVVGMMAAAIAKPLDTFLVNVTDGYLFQKKFDYHKLLKDSSKQMAFIQSFDDLAKKIVVFLLKQWRIRNAAILVPSPDQKRFITKFPLGYGRKSDRPDMVISVDHPLISHLERKHAPVDLEMIEDEIKSRQVLTTGQMRDLEAVRDAMKKLKAAVLIPTFLGVAPLMGGSPQARAMNLRTILVLGSKKSDDMYSEEDLNVFFTLAQESAIAVENARLYDEAVKRAKELERINRELNTASTRLLRALSDTEQANKRLKDTQSLLIHEQKMATMGRLAASVGHEVNNPLTVLSMNVSRVLLRLRNEPDLKVTDILSIFEKMEHNIARIKAVVNTLTGLLKKSERGRIEPLSVKILIEETLPLVQFQTYLDNLTGTEVEFDIPADIWLVRGDLERLQEVFLNLFINAYQAMSGRRDRLIRITARNEEDAKRVHIDFADNGCGMPEEVLRKIFNFRFTTKKEGQGSGIGLYMCRYIIELHGGEISCRSKPNEGTVFTVKLPMYEEEISRGAFAAGGQR